MHSRVIRRATLLVALSAATAGAQQLPQNVELHGFGSWNSGATNNRNLYLGGKWKGSSMTSDAGFNISGEVNEKVSFMTQVKFAFDGATNPSLDYAFAQYKFRDDLKLRAGQVRQPFGLYTEVMDVGTLHPFLYLPQSQYGPTAVVAEAYRGVGLTGNVNLPGLGGMSMDYDIYGGGLNRKEAEFTLDMYRALQGRKPFGSVGHEVGTEVTDQLYGGRAMFNLPIEGLRVGISGYHSITGEVDAGRGWVSTGGYGLEYNANRLTFRSEDFHQWENDHDEENGWYYESAYRVFDKWQLAARFDRSTVHLKPVVVSKNGLNMDQHPIVGQSLLEHRELAAGLNYLFSPNFVMKASYHYIRGNHFAQPVADDALVAAYRQAEIDYQNGGAAVSPVAPKTSTVLLGAQFSF